MSVIADFGAASAKLVELLAEQAAEVCALRNEVASLKTRMQDTCSKTEMAMLRQELKELRGKRKRDSSDDEQRARKRPRSNGIPEPVATGRARKEELRPNSPITTGRKEAVPARRPDPDDVPVRIEDILARPVARSNTLRNREDTLIAAVASSTWACETCTYVNDDTATKCGMCDAPRKGASPLPSDHALDGTILIDGTMVDATLPAPGISDDDATQQEEIDFDQTLALADQLSDDIPVSQELRRASSPSSQRGSQKIYDLLGV